MPSTLTVVIFIVLQLTQNFGCYAECRCRKESNIWDTVKKTVGGKSTFELLKYGAVAGAAVAATPLLVSAAGFGAGGIAAGSVAASIQSAWFGGAISGVTGSVFAGLQGIGTAGLGAVGKVAVASASSAAYKVYDTFAGGSDDKDDDCCKPQN